jgi:hypothetical protein
VETLKQLDAMQMAAVIGFTPRFEAWQKAKQNSQGPSLTSD